MARLKGFEPMPLAASLPQINGCYAFDSHGAGASHVFGTSVGPGPS